MSQTTHADKTKGQPAGNDGGKEPGLVKSSAELVATIFKELGQNADVNRYRDVSRTANLLWQASVVARRTSFLANVGGVATGVASALHGGSAIPMLEILAAASLSQYTGNRLAAGALWLRGRAALKTFDAFQAGAALTQGIEPYRMHLDLAAGGAVAQCVDAESGIFLVRDAGEQSYRVVNGREFEAMRDRIALAGGDLDLVMIQHDEGTEPVVSIAHYRAGHLHGDTAERPATSIWRGVSVERHWYNAGQEVAAPVLNGHPVTSKGVDLESGLDPFSVHARMP